MVVGSSPTVAAFNTELNKDLDSLPLGPPYEPNSLKELSAPGESCNPRYLSDDLVLRGLLNSASAMVIALKTATIPQSERVRADSFVASARPGT